MDTMQFYVIQTGLFSKTINFFLVFCGPTEQFHINIHEYANEINI